MNKDSTSALCASLDWDKQGGLLPAIVQDAATLRVLMLGYMDRGALEATLAEGRVSFFSRSRGTRWRKGDTSGHWLETIEVHADCDRDSLLVMARAHGPTCHLDRCSCFGEVPGDTLAELDAVVAERVLVPRGRYTDRLLASPLKAVAQKVGEEGVEVALAAVSEDDEALLGEAADLLYHLVVLLRRRGLSIARALGVLRSRAGN